MSEISVNILDDEDISYCLQIDLYDPAQSDGIDVWTVSSYDSEGYHQSVYFEAHESCESIDIVSLAITALNNSSEN